MDPVSQGVLGAALPQGTASRRRAAVVGAGICGFLAGLAPDLDVFIRSSEDPLLFLEYHRQFTHSLIFIPVGGLIMAAVMHGLLGRWLGLGFLKTYLFCTLGYGTHGLLDFATSYGTMLLWPFSFERYSASIISIIDPLFTLPILVLVILAGIRRSPLPARLALVWALIYLGLGVMQQQSARSTAEALAAKRGHTIDRLTIKPSFGNIVVWRSVYEADGQFHIDAIRAGLRPKVFEGRSVPKLDRARAFPWLDPSSQQSKDLDRFARFSSNHIALLPGSTGTVVDVRFSALPNTVGALWSIRLSEDAGPTGHVTFQNDHDNARGNLMTLLSMIFADGQPKTSSASLK